MPVSLTRSSAGTLGMLLVLVTALTAGNASSAYAQEAEFRWVNKLPESRTPGLTHGTFFSRANQADVGYYIYLPPGYGDAPNTKQRYPVVYYLHGGRPGGEHKSIGLAATFDSAMKAGRAPPMIYVFVNGGAMSHYDFPAKKSLGETAFVRELIPHIDATYRTIARRAGRGIEGFSQGGRGAARIMFKHPELFCSAAPMGGGQQHEKHAAENGGKETSGIQFEPGNNTYDLARQYAPRREQFPLAVLVAVGQQDFNYEANLDWMRHLDALQIPYTKRIAGDAPHSAKEVYRRLGDEALLFHAANFAAAAQQAEPEKAAAQSRSSRPNILWLTSEDHGPQMGCYGDKLARTPNVDALAAKGLIFQRAWSCFPVCAPARSAIISGMYPTSTGAEHMRSMAPLPTGTKMYPQFLREAGYYCTNNSKEDYNLAKPGQVWDESSNKAHWNNRRAEQPFFAIFNSQKSHESQLRTRPHVQITDPAKVRVPAYHPDTPEVRQDWAQYYDKVSEVDADAGARLKELAEAGLTEDTIVFYYGDHGSGMPRSKRWPSNSGLHVPLVVYFPEKWRALAPKEYQAGGKSDRLINFVDLAPTVLSLAGVRPPEWMQGHAFAGEFQTAPQPFLHGCRGRMDESRDLVRSVTDGRYVYLRNYYPHLSQGQHVTYQFETPTTRVWHQRFVESKTTPAQSIFWSVPKAPEELYDLQNDPDEVQNLAASPQHQDILQRLRKAQRDHAAKIRDVGFLPEGEIHSRSQGTTPYDMAHDDAKYPFQRIFDMAELASSLSSEATPQLTAALSDADSAVRYWAALGLLMRGDAAIQSSKTKLVTELQDSSPYVRIVAAQALAQHGAASDLPAALATLKELAPCDKNGVFVSMAALTAVQALGPKAAPLLETVRTMTPSGPSPDGRFDSYVPRLIADITRQLGGEPPAAPAPAKAKRKAKAKAQNKSAP